jgi:baseplate J-like protein
MQMDKIPMIHNLSKEDLIRSIKELSMSYTPHWRFDPDNPDIGTALGMIFADMQADTLRRYSELPLKWRTDYFNNLHASLEPEQPAYGYVSFRVVNDEVQGTELPAGTRLTTDVTDNAGDIIPVETREDVFVAPSTLQAVYESNDKLDYIGKLWDETEEKPFCLFGFDGENLQHHVFMIGHDSLFDISQGGEVEAVLYTVDGHTVSEGILRLLISSGKFYYSTEEGYEPFAQYRVEEGKLIFVKANGQVPWCEKEIDGIHQFWIRYETENGRSFERMSIGEIRLKSRAAMIAPQAIYAAGTDVDTHGYYSPFGEELSIYEEVYFSCDDVFSKKGSEVTMSFLMDFTKIPLNLTDKMEIDWRLIMPRSAVRVDPEYDISITKVLWEYFNGTGWVRLFDDNRYDEVFSPITGTGRQKKILRFICPQDMAPVIVNSVESRCIRARIVNLDNRFKTKGQYIVPMLSETYFSYEYQGKGLPPQYLYDENNGIHQLNTAKNCFQSLRGYSPIRLAGDQVPAVYCCFSNSLEQGPIRILALLGAAALRERPRLKWQYFGNGKWRDLNVADETKGFQNSGLISFNGKPDFEKTSCFGKEGYWIRIQDIFSGYDHMPKKDLPLAEGFLINSVKAWTLRTDVEESLTYEDFAAVPEFQLLHRPIFDAQIWVNETGNLSKAEQNSLQKDGRIRFINVNPNNTETWVLWQQTESFYENPEDGRKYTLDKANGILRFSAGTNYRLPPPGVSNGIYVNMRIGGGEEGNLQKGAITGTELNYGFINQVWNPIGFSGGCNKETPDEAMERTAAAYKHHHRAVTAADYEKLAKEASRMVYRAFCFTGRIADGSRKSGYITLVILQKDYEKSHYYFHSLRDIIMEYMKDKVFENLLTQNRLQIVSPDFIEIQVGAEVKVQDFNEIFQCKRQIMQKLHTFFNPISGNFTGNGFSVGVLPNRSQIETVIKSILSVKEISNLVISGNLYRGGEVIELNMEEMRKYPFALPVDGKHRIFVSTE